MSFNNIPTSLLIFLLIQAFWVIAFFGVIQHVVVKAISNERWRDRVEFFTPLFRNVAWMLFTINAIYHLASVNPIVSLAVVGVVLALGWKSVRDFVNGTIFRFQKGDMRGQQLKVKDLSGTISKMQTTKIELVTSNEEIIQIPYSQIISTVTTKPTTTKHLKTANIFLDLPPNNSLEESKTQVKKQLLNLPWVVSNKGVKVEKSDDDTQLKITFSTLTGEYVEKVKGVLKEEKN